MNQEVLLLLVFEPKEHILLTDVEADFSSSDIDPCPGGPQEWSSKNELHNEVAVGVLPASLPWDTLR
jgi:hypothetical protein